MDICFIKNLISKAEIRKCLKSAKYAERKIMMNRSIQILRKSYQKKNKQILVRIENFLKKGQKFN